MKNLLKGISLAMLLILTANMIGYSQDFMGTVTYKMSVEGDMSEAEKAQSEGTVTFSYGDGVQKKVIQTMMATITQIDYADSSLMMQEAMGQSMAFRMSKDDKEKLEAQVEEADSAGTEPKVTLIEETKVIAGLKCKKAEIEDGETIMEVYYYPEYTVQEFMQEDEFKDIKGLPLEYSVSLGDNGSIHFVATEVKKKKKMKAKDFALPADVKIMEFEEVKAMMGL